ncbi:hypothetical protein SKAU_G00238800, partial [Synaphobranchus kaupii]
AALTVNTPPTGGVCVLACTLLVKTIQKATSFLPKIYVSCAIGAYSRKEVKMSSTRFLKQVCCKTRRRFICEQEWRMHAAQESKEFVAHRMSRKTAGCFADQRNV